MSDIRRVTVIGAGTMGHGIAYVAAAAGYETCLVDADADALRRAMDRVRASFDRAIEKKKATEADRDAALGRLRAVAETREAVRDADLVIEAVPESLDLKRRLFADVEGAVRDSAILGTNTSSLSVSEIASATGRPDRVVGLHFFNPVPVMKLLEIVRGRETSERTVTAARTFAESLGKTPIVVKDTPGFATSRLGVVLGLEAMRMLEQGVASAQDIDRAMELGYNHPMGPLRLTDLVGLDVRLAIADHLHRTLGDDTYRAPEVLRRLVAEGKLGKKSGEGFYRWENDR